MKAFPFLSPGQSYWLLRTFIALIMMSHGAMRLIVNSLASFGQFLNGEGFYIGPVLAWGVTIFELIGGLLMILGVAVRWISLTWILVLVTGIVLVHAKNGWFVVGHQSGGMEYSFLLIVCLLVIAAGRQRPSS